MLRVQKKVQNNRVLADQNIPSIETNGLPTKSISLGGNICSFPHQACATQPIRQDTHLYIHEYAPIVNQTLLKIQT